jgi:diaminopimelate decarboxylase
MNTPLTHSPLSYFLVEDDCLLAGGIPVTELAARIGGTPFYAYDRRLISERIQQLRAHLPPEIRIHYALKANPMPALAGHVAPLVDGLDVASLGELQIALNTGIPSKTISFAGPGKSNAELTAALAAGIIINLESEGEMERLAYLAGKQGNRPKIAVRVNPNFELKTSGMKMAGGPKPFGVDAECVPTMLARLRELDLDFYGFHIFSGSQNLRAESIIEAQERTFKLALELACSAPTPVRLLNIGGGFGIPYFPGDKPLDLKPIADNLAACLPKVRMQLPEAEVIIELGRYLVGEAGIYVCEVIDRKVSRGQVFLVTNGGLHHHLAASGNFGQVIRKNYPVVVGNRVQGSKREIVSVVGPLCTPLDILADRMELAYADVGDLIVVLQSGAYGRSASPLGFLSHPIPFEVLV